MHYWPKAGTISTKLNQLIDSLSPAGQGAEFPPGTMNRNIRDVLAHLYHWHLMMLDWYIVGMRGDKPEMPAKGYGWKDTPKLNKYIWEKYQGTSLAEARSLLDNSHKKITQLIEKHSDDELFTKKYYKWDRVNITRSLPDQQHLEPLRLGIEIDPKKRKKDIL